MMRVVVAVAERLCRGCAVAPPCGRAGHIDAQEALGSMYVLGERVPKDEAKAAQWWQVAVFLTRLSTKARKWWVVGQFESGRERGSCFFQRLDDELRLLPCH